MTDKKKYIFSNLLSLILGVVIGVGSMGIVGNVRKTVKIPEQIATLPDHGGAVIGEAHGNGVRVMRADIPVEEYELYGVSTQAETAYVLTAVISPDNATNKKVDWSVSFKNAGSTWANGKNVTDYVTVAPSSDGALTATVQCLQAFGEQIAVTVTSRDNTAVTASCAVDYARKVTDYNVTINGGNDLNVAWTQDGNEYLFAVTPVFGIGTIDDTYRYSYTLNVRDEFSDAITFVPIGGSAPFVSKLTYGYSLNDNNMTLITSYSCLTNKFFLINYHIESGISGGTTSGLPSKSYSVAVNGLKNKITSYSGVMFDFVITATGEYGEFTKTVIINTAESNFSVGTTDISLNDDKLVF